VAAPDSLATVAADADETVCLAAPAYFVSVGRYYLNFEAVEDEAVVSALARYVKINSALAGAQAPADAQGSVAQCRPLTDAFAR
jgi:putative phosphoribosyl transferase